MSLTELGAIAAFLEVDVFGSTTVLIGFALVFVILLIVMAKINVFLAFMLIMPALLAFAAFALIPTWIAAVVWLIVGLILFFVIVSVFNR